ncbi:MAG: GntR family transcriptional regulator [Pseudomonadota bacterium]
MQTANEPWRAVYRDLRKDIDEGALRPGDALPTIAALSARTGLNAYAARRVMERLRDEGRVLSRQGRGFQVAAPRVPYRVGQRPRFTSAMTAQGFAVSTDFVAAGRWRLSDAMARRIGAPRRPAHLSAQMLRRLDGKPVALTRVIFPPNHTEGVLDALFATKSVTEALRAVGVADFERTHTEVSGRLPTASEAQTLDIARSDPVIVTTGISVDTNAPKTVVELNETIWRVDGVRLTF